MFPRPSRPKGPPGPPQNGKTERLAAQWCRLKKKLSHLSSKMPICGPAGARLRKRDDTLVRNGGLEKDLRHSRVECPFAIQLIRKRSFCSRVVKAKVVLHRKIQGCGHTPDPKWSFRSRVAKALIVFNGKSAYFCSILGPRDAQSMHIYG